jgi:hypothetical protein
MCDSFFPCSEQLYKSEADEEAFRNPHRWYGDTFRNPHRWYGDAAELICSRPVRRYERKEKKRKIKGILVIFHLVHYMKLFCQTLFLK